MRRLKCIMSYDGTAFSGYQIQPQKRTVQGEVEQALKKIHNGSQVRITASGRTDTGVHAREQVFHFDTVLQIAAKNWKKALNSMLPDDIFITGAAEVPATFHARYDAVEKEYRYRLYSRNEPDVFRRNYVCHYPWSLNVAKMQEAALLLEGEHDFTTFSSAKAAAKGSKVRTLYQVRCIETDTGMEFIFRGNGFLYHMVRILVGVLLEVGRELRTPSSMIDLLAAKDRQLAGETAPPKGLYLWRVMY